MSEFESEPIPLSPQQSNALKVFREQLFAEGILHEGDTIGTDDSTLLRFLRARKFNLNESKKMVKNCQLWRRSVSGIGIDELNTRMDPFSYPGRQEIFKSWSMYFHKTDKKGRPVNIQSFDGLNLAELYKHVSPQELVEFLIVNADALTREVLPAASRAAGGPIGHSLVITDLKGFGLSQFWQVKSLAQISFQISQDYYPETMGQLAIINAPSSFTFIWSMVKPWLSKETVEKVDILGKDYEDVLLRLVDADNLPAALGGNCTCSGAGGCSLSSSGPWMEERLAKKAVAEDGTCSARSSEYSTLAHTSGTHVEGNREPVNMFLEKVAHDEVAVTESVRAGFLGCSSSRTS